MVRMHVGGCNKSKTAEFGYFGCLCVSLVPRRILSSDRLLCI